MSNTTSGSWSTFYPQEVIDRISVHLQRIEIGREDKKKEWFDNKREEGKKVGIPFFKKRVDYTKEELQRIWEYGDDEWYWCSPKYEIWDTWNPTIRNFERIRDFCQLAIDTGNRTVNLSKEDALFAFNWS